MLDKIFLQILNMSFTGGVVIAFVLLVRLLLKKAPRIFSYALWSVVLFRLLCPFSFESAFSLLPTKANPIGQDIVYMQTSQINTGSTIINDSVNVILPPTTPDASVNQMQIWMSIFGVVWVIGIALLLAYSLVTLLQLKRRLKTAILYKNNIFLSHNIDTAFVLGVLCPKIYLPAHLTDGQREYILLHEQTHIKRFDHLIKVLSFFVLCLHWFNPLVWIAFFTSGKDMEMSCDEAVVKKLGTEVKKDYSTSLLTLATGRRMVGGTPLAFGEGSTKSRIKNVLNYKKPAFWVGVVALVAVICVILGLMVNPKTNSIPLPNQDEVTSIRIEQINEGSSLGFIETTTVFDIEIILASLKNSDKTLRQSVNNSPDIKNYFQINIAGPTTQILYLYNDNNQHYIEEPYSGIYKTNRITSLTIAKIYTANEGIYAEYNTNALWNSRTQYIGNNSAVGNLIGLLPVPIGLRYDHFELQTASQPYKIEIVYSVPTEELMKYDTETPSVANLFRANALLLLSLIDNADEIQATLTDGSRKVSFTNGREWANHTVGGDVRDYTQSPEKLQELIDFIYAGTNAETVITEYSIMKLGENGEVLSEYSLENQQLAEAIIRNALVKSAAWEGVDISTLKEYYRIRQTFPNTQEVHDYYAYRLKDGTAVLQSGAVGRYSTLSDDLYEALSKYVIYPHIDSDAQEVKDANYSQSLTAEELKQTEEVVRNHFTIEAPYYEGVMSIELMPDDYHLYKNKGIEGEYEAGNIIIYKVLTGRDKKDHNPERSISIARASKNSAWEVINQGY